MKVLDSPSHGDLKGSFLFWVTSVKVLICRQRRVASFHAPVNHWPSLQGLKSRYLCVRVNKLSNCSFDALTSSLGSDSGSDSVGGVGQPKQTHGLSRLGLSLSLRIITYLHSLTDYSTYYGNIPNRPNPPGLHAISLYTYLTYL